MIITQAQAKEKLGIGDARLLTLIKEGKLTPVNQPKPGATKFFRKFDSVAVNKLYTELRTNGTIKGTQAPVTKDVEPPSPKGVMSRLESIEAKLDRLIKLWS